MTKCADVRSTVACADESTHPQHHDIGVQNILRDPQRAEKMKGGGDGAFADAWIGNKLIHPAKGKLAPEAHAAEDHMAGGMLCNHVVDSDFGKPGRRAIDPSTVSAHAQHDTVQAISIGTATHDDWKSVIKSRRHFAQVPRKCPAGAPYRRDLSDILSGQAVDMAEAARNGMRWKEDADVIGKQRIAAPARDSAGGVFLLL